MIDSKIKKNFGFGCMRLPMRDGEVDREELTRMVDTFLECGFNYFDTARGYLKGKSEVALRECLTSRYPRESYVLTHKLSNQHFETEAEIRPLFESQLKTCGVEYFDIYMMHAQNRIRFAKYKACRAYEIAQELLAEGKIRHFGFSFHGSPAYLEKTLDAHPEVEFVISGINKGYNCGSDILYSGTVGAAKEGAIFGYPAMAVSLAPQREDLYDQAAKLAVRMFELVRAHPLPPRALLNVNHPAVDSPLGVRAVPMKPTHYIESYTRREEDGKVFYVLGGNLDMSMEKGEDDWSLLEDGYATATVIGFDMTDRKATEAFGALL